MWSFVAAPVISDDNEAAVIFMEEDSVTLRLAEHKLTKLAQPHTIIIIIIKNNHASKLSFFSIKLFLDGWFWYFNELYSTEFYLFFDLNLIFVVVFIIVYFCSSNHIYLFYCLGLENAFKTHIYYLIFGCVVLHFSNFKLKQLTIYHNFNIITHTNTTPEVPEFYLTFWKCKLQSPKNIRDYYHIWIGKKLLCKSLFFWLFWKLYIRFIQS